MNIKNWTWPKNRSEQLTNWEILALQHSLIHYMKSRPDGLFKEGGKKLLDKLERTTFLMRHW